MPKRLGKVMALLVMAALSATAVRVLGVPADRPADGPAAPAPYLPSCRVQSRGFVKTVRAWGELAAENVTTISSELSEHFITWRLPEGASVEEGDPVLKLDRGGLEEDILEVKGQIVAAEAAFSAAEGSFECMKIEIETEIEELAAELDVAEARLKYQQSKPLPERRAAAEAAARRAKANQAHAQYWRDMMRQMREEGLVGREELRRAELDRYTTTVEVRRTEKALTETLKGASPEDLESAEVALGEARLCLTEARETRDQRIQKARAELEAAGNRLESLQRRLSELEEDLGKTVLLAQHAGALFSHGNGKFSVGYPVYRGQIVADLADTSSLVLEARVRECDSQLVKEGQKVVVHLLSLLEEPLTGTVAEVGTSLTEDEGNSEVRYLGVKVTLDAVPAGAKPGMNAYADVTVEAMPSALVVPWAAVEGGIVTVLTESGPERREVEVLAVDGLFAAVKGPVAEGEWVVLNARE